MSSKGVIEMLESDLIDLVALALEMSGNEFLIEVGKVIDRYSTGSNVDQVRDYALGFVFKHNKEKNGSKEI